MKILLIGTFKSPIHEIAISNSFKNLGHTVIEIKLNPLFSQEKHSGINIKKKISNVIKKIQNKYNIGPIIKNINKELLQKSFQSASDLIFIFRGVHIFPETITQLRDRGFIVFGYNNDDPFGNSYNKFYWRYFIRSIRCYTHLFSYRHSNIEAYKDLGAESTSLLRSYYISSLNYHIPPEDIPSKYKNDVVFAGHYENDGRDIMLLKLLQCGIRLKIFGPEWKKSKYYNEFKRTLGVIKQLNNTEYNYALNGAKIALVFLSRQNNDTYTRRCFEIPSTQTLMISEYSEDLSELFEDKKEIVFFRNIEELKNNIIHYLRYDAERESIARNGYNRVMQDGHEVTDRAQEIINVYKKVTEQ